MISLRKKIINEYINTDDIFKIERKIMGSTGCWLNQSALNWKPLTGIFCHLFLNLGPKLNYVVKAFAASDGKKFAKCVPESFIVIWYIVTSIILMQEKETFKELYQLLVQNWRDGKCLKLNVERLI